MQGRRLGTIGLTRLAQEREEQQRRPPPTVLAWHVGLAARGQPPGTAAGTARPVLTLPHTQSAGPKAVQSSAQKWRRLIIAHAARNARPVERRGHGLAVCTVQTVYVQRRRTLFRLAVLQAGPWAVPRCGVLARTGSDAQRHAQCGVAAAGGTRGRGLAVN